MLAEQSLSPAETRRGSTLAARTRGVARSVLAGSLAACSVLALVSLWAVAGHASAASLTASVDQAQGLPALSLGSGSAMSSQFVFWAKNWSWANFDTKFKVVAPFNYELSGVDQTLQFNLSGHVAKPSDRQLAWTFDLDAAATMTNVIGGGIAFKFDLADFGSQLGEPQLLPGNRGWSWGRPGGAEVQMRFDPPLASVYFEMGRRSEIRALFYKGTVPQGRQHIVGTLTVSGGAAIVPTAAERFGLDSEAAWPMNILDWAKAPVDLSFLNAADKPAGRHGFLKAVDGRLVFADGTPARFWGTNLVAYALFATASQQAVRRQARRLSELGFNLARLHHIDSDWVQPNVFGMNAPDTQKLDETSLQKLDWWIKCLEDEGIYVWLDLDDGRQFKAGDKIDDFSEISKGRSTADLRGYNYVNTSIQEAMQKFNEAFLNHVNHFTGRRYSDDPGIVAVLLTNENDLTNHYSNALLPDKSVPHEDALYMAEAAAFAGKNGLPRDQTWRSWIPGPSKIFLNDLEHKFNAKLIGKLRMLGVKSPIVTTDTWGGNPLSSLPALTDGDIIDVHIYGGTKTLETNPLYAANLVDWIAAAHVADYPLSVTEWNVSPFPVADRDTVPLYVAGTADLQGWDALMEFAYSQQGLDRPGGAGAWESGNDPALMATLPAAALLYRRRDAKEARTTYVYAPTSAQLFDRSTTADNAVALRTAVEKGRLLIALPPVHELPWLKPSTIPKGATVITDPQQPQIASNAEQAVSDTGELTRNWLQGTYTINTPRTQAAMGWIGSKGINLADVAIDVTTRNATVAVQSLDGNPIRAAGALLISLGARAIPDAGNARYRSEPVVGQLTIRAKPGLKFYRREGDIQVQTKVPATYADGRYRIDLQADLGTYWLFMK